MKIFLVTVLFYSFMNTAIIVSMNSFNLNNILESFLEIVMSGPVGWIWVIVRLLYFKRIEDRRRKNERFMGQYCEILNKGEIYTNKRRN